MGFSLSNDTAVRRASEKAPEPAPKANARPAFTFKADVDIAELDERGRPGPKWAGKACEISRSHIVFRSRRLCYEEREVLVAVHLIDDRPVALFGRVSGVSTTGTGCTRPR